MFSNIIFCLVICVAVQLAQPANIFGVFTVYSKSHYEMIKPLLKELARSGHNLTVLTFFKTKNLPDNFHEIIIELPKHVYDEIEGNFFKI